MPRRRGSEKRTEYLLTELLKAQGWDIRKPPKGEFLRQQEYKDFPELLSLFQGKSKTGKGGDALPEGIIVERTTLDPIMIFEVKSKTSEIDKAVHEVTNIYGMACIEGKCFPLAVGLAGTTDEEFEIRVLKWDGSKWVYITYENNPISWIPNPNDANQVRQQSSPSDLKPTSPSLQILAERADQINRLLRESGIKDEWRPSVVAAFMLALWKPKDEIRRSPNSVLVDVNASCREVFEQAKKPELARSIFVDEANVTLATKAREILRILQLLNVTVLTSEHDYLGQLYETFFRYTGGNTIGQYFTPRHVTKFMTDLCEVNRHDVVLDPACGSGGFLIAAMQKMQEQEKISREQVVAIIKSHLLGIEIEPVTAALCIANMIFRGDGSTGIRRGDCFNETDFPLEKGTVVLMNPPFPHAKTDTPPEDFIMRALEGLKQNGRLAVIIPGSLLVKNKEWRKNVLKSNTLNGVITLPGELFQPYASANTAILLMTKGIPHDDKVVFFSYISKDGLTLKKKVRVPCDGSQLPKVLSAYKDRESVPDLCGKSRIIKGEWHPGAYIPASCENHADLLREIDILIRSKTSVFIKYAPQLIGINALVDDDEIQAKTYQEYVRTKFKQTKQGTIGFLFEVYYGLKELENTSNLVPGNVPIITSSGSDNGLYGFYYFEKLISPPFITVPRTGSIGEAHVQEWPCGVNNNCLILVPRSGITIDRETMFLVAGILRAERWRFNYGRVLTPSRAAEFPVPEDEGILNEIRIKLNQTDNIEKAIYEQYQKSNN
jgi:type I restriction-modification system DNA methylase subunit